MYPDTIPPLPPTEHDTLDARTAYIASNADVDYEEWLQETYYAV